MHTEMFFLIFLLKYTLEDFNYLDIICLFINLVFPSNLYFYDNLILIQA